MLLELFKFLAKEIHGFNVFSQYVFDYGGTGFGTGSSASPALSQNRLNSSIAGVLGDVAYTLFLIL